VAGFLVHHEGDLRALAVGIEEITADGAQFLAFVDLLEDAEREIAALVHGGELVCGLAGHAVALVTVAQPHGFRLVGIEELLQRAHVARVQRPHQEAPGLERHPRAFHSVLGVSSVGDRHREKLRQPAAGARAF